MAEIFSYTLNFLQVFFIKIAAGEIMISDIKETHEILWISVSGSVRIVIRIPTFVF
jgi:hypothetical protein